MRTESRHRPAQRLARSSLVALVLALAASAPALARAHPVLGHPSLRLRGSVLSRHLPRARPLELVRRGPGPARAHAAYGGEQPAFPINSEGWAPEYPFNRSTGRLYATDDWHQLGECTATVIALRVLLTAAHCLWNEATGAYYRAFAFVPGQYGASAPLGTWWGRTPAVWSDWISAPSESRDYGFLTVYSQRAREIGAVTGTRGLLIDAPLARVISLGYPAGDAFAKVCDTNGTIDCYPWYCDASATERVVDPGGHAEIGMGCNSAPGSSGSPWLEASGGSWRVASTVSTDATLPPDPGYSTNQWGPYFDADTRTLLGRVEAAG